MLALLAFVVPTVVLAVTGYDVGAAVGRQAPGVSSASDLDLGLLTPVRGSVLTGEIALWAGTAVGVWAMVQGIVATARRRGRGAGIAAIVIAALAPVAVAIALTWSFTAGVATAAASAF